MVFCYSVSSPFRIMLCIITSGHADLVILKITVYMTVQHATVIIPIRKNVNLPTGKVFWISLSDRSFIM